jgi:hypothetical protein
MKKIYFLLIILLVFNGCKKSTLSSPNSIVGKWTITQELAIYYVNSVEVYREFLPLTAGESLEFKTDGTLNYYGLINGVPTTITGSYSLINNNTTLHVVTSSTSTSGYDKGFAFVDMNTFTTNDTAAGIGTTTYKVNGVTHTANGETVITTFVRL